ncbi:MAG TPA: hypothetical protein VFI90_06500 [Rubrobacter sp.]|nr:hypothetical protein [Rubrobacter sp.]
MRWLVGFGRFWYDFIVGDSAVLAAGGAGALILGLLVVEAGSPVLAQVVLPLGVVVTLTAGLRYPRG